MKLQNFQFAVDQAKVNFPVRLPFKQVVAAASKRADLRDVSLKTLDRTDAVLTQFAKLGGLYITDKERQLEERLAQLELMLEAKTRK